MHYSLINNSDSTEITDAIKKMVGNNEKLNSLKIVLLFVTENKY